MRQGHMTSEDILLGQLGLEAAELSEMGALGEGWWRPDASHTCRQSMPRPSRWVEEQPDWLSAQRQENGVEPDDEEPE